MSRLPVINIDQISIATPCQADWKDMVGDDQARLCLSCEKNVYNLSSMTRAEVSTLIVETEGKFCGRLFRRKDGKVLTADCPLGIRERVEIAASKLGIYVFVGVLTAFALVLALIPQRRGCAIERPNIGVVEPMHTVDDPVVNIPDPGESHLDALRRRAQELRDQAEARRIREIESLRDLRPKPGGMRPPPAYFETKGDVALPDDVY